MPLLQSEPILKPRYDSFYYMAFGTGADLDVDFDGASTVLGIVPAAGVYTLTRDIFPSNMRIRNGAQVWAQGFVPYVAGRLLIDVGGVLCARANDASGLIAGASLSAVGTLGNTGAAGGGGRNITGAGNNASGAGSNNVSGVGGGDGGTAGGANTGGTGNTTVSPIASSGSIQEFGAALRKRLQGTNTFNGSGGGGGGGCDVTAGAAKSGGGGGSNITLLFFCRELENYGTIHADGGTGANGTSPGGGIAGGGGGGSAGAVIAVVGRLVYEGTIRASAGSGGSGAGGGASGNNGTGSGKVVKFYGQPT